jgi:hypothetical protein
MKESFIIYQEWNVLIQSLEHEERLLFYDTLFNFNDENIPVFKSKHLQAVVNFVFSKVIENNKKYSEKSKKNSDNAKKRWDKPASEIMRSHAVAKIAMLNDNDNDNVNDNDNDNVNDNVKVDFKKNQNITGKWFKKCTESEFINEVQKFKNENPTSGYPEILFQDFINHYTTPNENGGIRVNQFSSFGIKNKLYEMKTDPKHAGKYEIKTPSKTKLYYE